MSMSKKDFIGIAEKLKAVRPIHPDHDSIDHTDSAQINYQRGAFTYWEQSCRAVADYCRTANHNFDRIKFLEACND